MKITRILWDNSTISHIARHGVEPQEVEDVCFKNNPSVLKARKNRHFVLGQTDSGRYLTIIIAYLGSGKASVITARAMSEAEKQFYKRR